MKRDLIIALIKQYLESTISEHDSVRLKEVLNALSEEDLLEIWDEILTGIDVSKDSDTDMDRLFNKMVADRRVQMELFVKKQPSDRFHKIRYYAITLLAAASLILIIKFSINKFTIFSSQQRISKRDHNSILPGRNQARILLADGKILDLGKIKNDTLIHLDGYSINKSSDGTISYQFAEKEQDNSAYNTIITPKGGQYKVLLSDGTKIALNSSSILRYPIHFNGDRRKVELTGEAYFEVEKLNRNGKRVPFIVKTDQQLLEVLGTEFNINSYSGVIKTTLVQGSVKLTYENNKIDHHVLKPNEQAVYAKQSAKLEIAEVDPYYTVAWKNGSFAFDNASLAEVMESLARWYDFSIVFQDDSLKMKRFSGAVSRFEQIEKVLDIIEITGSVKFKIVGRRVLVLK